MLMGLEFWLVTCGFQFRYYGPAAMMPASVLPLQQRKAFVSLDRMRFATCMLV